MTVDPIPLRFERKKIELPFRSQAEHNESGVAALDISRVLTIESMRILSSFSVYPAIDDDDEHNEFIIDTGAPISVFPRKTWRSWPDGTVEWFEPSNERARLATEVKGITGDITDARFGRVKIILWKLDTARPGRVIQTAPFLILAKFLTKETTVDRAILGMSGNAMERWQKLVIDFQLESASLE